MSWQLCLVDAEKLATDIVSPGTLWFAPWLLGARKSLLYPGAHYFARNKGRPPLLLRLPGGFDFSVDGCPTKAGERQEPGWLVSGGPPEITIEQVICVPGVYRGTLIRGELSDDMDGRKYER